MSLGLFSSIAQVLRDHADVFIACALLLSTALFFEWSLARRLSAAFTAHELTEARLNATLALTAEAAAAAAIEATRLLRVLRVDMESAQELARVIAADVKMHDQRLGAMEERLMRLALIVPSPRRTDDPP